MGCRLWFCCSPRAVGRFVGIFDLLVGTLGIALSVLLFISSEKVVEEDASSVTAAETVFDQDTTAEYRQLGLGYFFPSILTFVVGLATLISVSNNHIRIARLAYVLNILLIVGQIGVFIVLFVMGIHWMNIFPILFFGLLQILFIFGIQSFIKEELSIESV